MTASPDSAHELQPVTPPSSTIATPLSTNALPSGLSTAASSQIYTVTRYQRSRLTQRLKFTSQPSIFQSLTNDWEFAGWGGTEHVRLTDQEIAAAQARRAHEAAQRVLGQWKASAVAGNDVVGSPVYSIPAVVALSSV
jgi:hypothetical protein